MLATFIINYTCRALFLHQLVASLATYALLRLTWFYTARYRHYQLYRHYGVPGPRPTLLKGNCATLGIRPYTYEIDEALKHRYGRNFVLFLGDLPILTVTDLDILKKVFIEDTDNFKERSVPPLDTITIDSVLFAKHKDWKIYRKILSPSLNRYAIKGDYSTRSVRETVRLVIDYIDSRLESDRVSGKLTVNIDVHNLMKSAALHMISAMAIKLSDTQITEYNRYTQYLDKFLSQIDGVLLHWIMSAPLIGTALNAFSRRIEVMQLGIFKSKLDMVIDNQHATNDHLRSTNQQNQIVDTLIRLHHEGKIPRDAIVGNCMAILLAAYDTTSTTLAYLLWVLAKHDNIQDKLRSELIAHGTESEYLEQVINETFRLYPAVKSFTNRMASESVQYKGLMIPKGTLVSFNTWLVHRDPDIWPDPMRFDPERFRTDKSHHPCAFAPFGFGERRCLGFELAMFKIRTMLCDIIIRYRVRLVSPIELKQYAYTQVLTKPLEKIMVQLERVIC